MCRGSSRIEQLRLWFLMDTHSFTVADVNISLISEMPLKNSGPIHLFYSDFEKADYCVSLRKGEIEPLQNSFYNDNKFDYYQVGETIAKIFYNSDKKGSSFKAVETSSALECIMDGLDTSVTHDLFYITGYINLPHIMLLNGRLMLHSCYIIHEGEAILFCGNSGVGKSTQGALWEKFAGAEVINGDKSVIYPENGRLIAYSTPLCGTSKICKNKNAPVKAIVLLSQGDKNRLERLSPSAAIAPLMQVSHYDFWRDGEAQKAMNACVDAALSCPVFSYICRKDESAVETLLEALSR